MAESRFDFAMSQCAGAAQLDHADCVNRNLHLWDVLQAALIGLNYIAEAIFWLFILSVVVTFLAGLLVVVRVFILALLTDKNRPTEHL